MEKKIPLDQKIKEINDEKVRKALERFNKMRVKNLGDFMSLNNIIDYIILLENGG